MTTEIKKIMTKQDALDALFPVHAALREIISAADANSHPIHFKVREAIENGRKVLSGDSP